MTKKLIWLQENLHKLALDGALLSLLVLNPRPVAHGSTIGMRPIKNTDKNFMLWYYRKKKTIRKSKMFDIWQNTQKKKANIGGSATGCPRL